MNLKEAFRFQNKLQSMMDEGSAILSQEQNITQVKTTYLRKKVMAGAEDETIMEQPSHAIQRPDHRDRSLPDGTSAGAGEAERRNLPGQNQPELPAGFDGEVGLNGDGVRIWPACSPHDDLGL